MVAIGGGAGSGIAPVICEEAKKSGVTVAIACMPLDSATLKADPGEALRALKCSADIVFVADPNFANFGVRNTSDADRSSWAEEQTRWCVSRFISTIHGDGIIGVDVADIFDLFRRSKKSYYGFGTAAVPANDGKHPLTRSMMNALDQHYAPGFRRTRERVKGGVVCFSFPRSLASLEDIRTAFKRLEFELGDDKGFIFQAVLDDTLRGAVRTDIWLTA